jgi:hypothetical protein
LIKTADLMVKHTEDVNLHVMEAFTEIMPLTWHGHADPVKAFQPLEDPPYGWRRCGLIDWVGHGLMGLGSWRSKSAWRHGVDQSRQGHHHEQPVNPDGFFDHQRRDEQPRVVAQPNAPCTWRLTCVGDEDLGLASRAGGAMGAKDSAGLGWLVLRQRVVIRLDLSLDWPRDGLERRARGGTAWASVAVVWSPRRGLHAVRRPALGHRGEGLLSGFGGGNALGLPVTERLGAGLAFARCGVVARGFGTFKRGPCRPHQPPLGHASVTPR